MQKSRTTPLSIAQNTAWNAVGSLFYLGCQWLTTVLVVVLSTGYKNSGLLSLAMSFGVIYSAIALFKIRAFQVSDVKAEYSPQQYVFSRIATCGVTFVVFAVVLAFNPDSRESLFPCLLYLVFKFDESFSDVLYGIEQQNSRMDYIGISQIVRGAVSLAGFSLGMVLTDNISIAIVAMWLPCFCVTLFYDIPKASLFGPPLFALKKLKTDGRGIVSLLRICSVGMVASLLLNSIVSVARIRYGFDAGNELLGIYSCIATPAVLIQVSIGYLYAPQLSLLGKLWNFRDATFMTKIVKLFGIALVLIAVGVVVVGILCQPLLILVFGNGISEYVGIFPWVICATGGVALLCFMLDSLIVCRAMVSGVAITLVAFVVSLILFNPLVNAFGMNGINVMVVVSCVVGIVLGYILLTVKFRKHMNGNGHD